MNTYALPWMDEVMDDLEDLCRQAHDIVERRRKEQEADE